MPPRPPHTAHPHAGQRILFGLAIVGIGVLALLDNLHVFDIALLRTFWPLGLVLWGVGRLVWRAQAGSAMVGVLAIGAGLVLTAENLDYLRFDWQDWWPLLIIGAGVSILMRGLSPRPNPTRSGDATAHGARVDIDASFSGINQRIDSRAFQGGRISCTFGGVELDLTQAAMAGDEAVLDIAAHFSGVDLRVPRDWLVVVEVASVFGGIEDKTVPPMNPGPRLVLRGDVMFAGLDIKN